MSSLSSPFGSSSPDLPPHPLSLDESIRWILSKNFDADSKVCFLTLLKIIDNILQKPGNDKVRTLRPGNKTIQSKIIEKQGHYVLLACGFVHEPADLKWQKEERLVLGEAREDTQLLIRARHTLARIATLELKLTAEDLPPYIAPPTIKPAPSGGGNNNTSNKGSGGGFDVYAGNRFDGQSAAAGTNLGAPQNWTSKTQKDLEKLQQRQAVLQKKTTKSKSTIDRQWTVFVPGQQPPSQAVAASASSSGPAATSLSSLSTKGDTSLLASHFKQQHANRVASENRGFTTKAMRDLEKLKKTKIYSHTQLAIHFPDGLSVRANFATSETIGDVLEGLSQHVLFETDTLPLPSLELYQTPPRRVLEATKTLKELGLVPAAKVYVSWKRALPKIGGTGLGAGWYIQPRLLQGTAAGLAAPSLPTSVPVVRQTAAAARAALGGNAAAPKKKKTKAEKEALMMKRMLGK